PLYAGIYEVSYFASHNEITSFVKKEVSVEKDVTAPVLTITFETTKIRLGEQVIVPSASVKDDYDENPVVEVKVINDGNTVATGSFTPTKAGVYRIIYTATDKDGNVSVKNFDVLVSDASASAEISGTDDNGKKTGCKKGCKGVVDGTGIVLALAAGISIITLKRKNKKTGD
ncbi:MAG: hypothetical protein SO003_01000, partial [Candidatus Borkfalkiaceae bacterium]|nr:hypothetical protein [Christensenellaceae bacterium]